MQQLCQNLDFVVAILLWLLQFNYSHFLQFSSLVAKPSQNHAFLQLEVPSFSQKLQAYERMPPRLGYWFDNPRINQ